MTQNVVWCEECEDWECAWCYDVNSRDPADVELHAASCAERAGAELP